MAGNIRNPNNERTKPIGKCNDNDKNTTRRNIDAANRRHHVTVSGKQTPE